LAFMSDGLPEVHFVNRACARQYVPTETLRVFSV
jgi:hypothetical protein